MRSPPRLIPLLRIIGFLAAGALLHAQGGLLPANGIVGFTLQSPDATTATRSVIAVNGQSFNQAVRVQSAKIPANPWLIQLNSPTHAAVAAGDVLAGEVWLRRVAPEDGAAIAELIFEQAGTPFTQSLARVLPEDSGTWTRYRFAFGAAASYPAGGAQVNVRLGHAVQTIEVGGLLLVNHGKTDPLSSFPNDFTYAGRASDASWRTNALAAIEKNRKSQLTVEVFDAGGFPVPGADLEIVETHPAFAFGSAVVASRLLGASADDLRYQGVVTNWFDTVVLENDLKWPTYEANPTPAQKAVDWLQAHHVAVRGHNVIWPGTNQPSFLPADVKGLFADPARLRARINGRFTNVLTRFQGRLADWDVINEPVHERAVEGVLGRQELAQWYQIAHHLDPAATLYLNDYENLESAGRDGTSRLRQLADDLRGRGAPLDALGLQSHFSGYLTPPSELLVRLDLLSGVNPPASAFPLRVTEFDINTDDEALQADYTRDFMIAVFSHPAVNGMLMWGFWASQDWLPRAALLRSNWEPKPSALVWSNLTQHAFVTRTNLRTSSVGRASLRAFRGAYQIHVRLPGQTNELSSTVLTDTNLRTTVPVIAPQLSVATGEVYEFSWPAYASGYALQFSDRLDPPEWQPVETIPMYSAKGWKAQLPPPDSTRFYRLYRAGGP